MATLILSAAGAAVGSAIGGAAFGLSATVIGRTVGAVIGQAIDQRLLGAGSEAVETGRVERFRLTDAAEGAPVPLVFGKMRVGGQVIWASRFLETSETTGGGGGKGSAPATPEVTSYAYSVSLAIALCEGAVQSVGRIWADGGEIDLSDLNLRFYPGTHSQMPDPRIAAIEGAGETPAFRGMAYVVIEDLPLGQFGNRVPQFSFEIYRPARPDSGVQPLSNRVPGVAMIPGTGEYALSNTPVYWSATPGRNTAINVNAPGGVSDFNRSLRQLRQDMAGCGAVSLIVSWFGDDLRCGACTLRPKVEQRVYDAERQPYDVGGQGRWSLPEVPRIDDRPIYGGTPNDRSVVEAIGALRAAGKAVTYYPFILMDQLEGNTLPDPYGDPAQPMMPWRGRITLSVAPGREGSPDGTATAAQQVAAFFGNAQVGDYTLRGQDVRWQGTPDWKYRHFILHQAWLCRAAGGVSAFCIGSEMRGLTQVRGAGNSFPAVAALRQLARDVRAILGPETKIGYAADWSEYFGYHPQDGSGDVFFHLDPLWSDSDIDFIGIDNYMPLSDWRDGLEHLDADAGAIHALPYLQANIAGGEGFEWYYRNAADRAAQIRTPIVDGLAGEDWVFRYKDLRGWWSNAHHDRVNGVRAPQPTGWVPQSKPIWFMEVGCAAIDKGTNQPNKFLDLRSSESALPYFSSGRRDDLMQHAYYAATLNHWAQPDNNPVSSRYGGRMVEVSRIHAWAWDARPYPFFPNNTALWSDGVSYGRGHWLNGRITAQDLAAVVSEICDRAGLENYDVSDLRGLVKGYTLQDVQSARAALQPLMLTHGFEAVERNGTLFFQTRRDRSPIGIDPERLAVTPDLEGRVQRVRAPEAEMSGRVRLQHVEAGGDYALRAAEVVLPGDSAETVSQSSLPISLSQAEGLSVVERWLAEARVARDSLRLALPMSRGDVTAGSLVRIAGESALYRVDRVEEGRERLIEAVRVAGAVYEPSDAIEVLPPVRPFQPPVPVFPVFMDLPVLQEGQPDFAPRLAVAAQPWPGSVAVYGAPEDAGYELDKLVQRSAAIGVTETGMARAKAGVLDRGPALRVAFTNGAPTSVSQSALLRGANVAAIGDGSPKGWELFQFRQADLVAPGTYDLSLRLRGQAGTEGEMQENWPAGSLVVLLGQGIETLPLQAGALGTERFYRVGPAQRPIDDPSFVLRRPVFTGLGLRPYAPAHLRVIRDGGDFVVSFTRRTRVDGDRWDLPDVPLGETREAYLLRLRAAGRTLLREVTLSAPDWRYGASQWAADGSPAAFRIEVAQLSERFGPGAWKGIEVNADNI